jgi:hypothetical protein
MKAPRPRCAPRRAPTQQPPCLWPCTVATGRFPPEAAFHRGPARRAPGAHHHPCAARPLGRHNQETCSRDTATYCAVQQAVLVLQVGGPHTHQGRTCSADASGLKDGRTLLCSQTASTQQPSNPATQQPSNPATQQPSNPATQQPSNPATQCDGLETRGRPGEPGRHGDRDAEWGRALKPLKGTAHIT